MKYSQQILLIDDDELDRKSVLREIRKYDSEINCIEASSCEESIEILSQREFDAILLDFRLASETGLEVLKSLNSYNLLNAPVIMLSGMNDDKLILECLENGAQDYLLKSEFNVQYLLKSIRYANERMHLLKQVTALANYDSLTGLANRSRFTEHLETSLMRAKRRNEKFAVLYIDLDHFKNINDTLGHEIGDLLLISVSSRLRDSIRSTDVVARLGGDEFAIIAEDIHAPHHITPLAEKIIHNLSFPHGCESHEINVTPSIGIAIFPESGDNQKRLLRSADTAMYHAKVQGRNNYQFFHPQLHAHVAERLAIENGMRQALDRNEMRIHFQPQVDIQQNRVVGVEALLRWQSQELGTVSPARFIPIAEDCGLIKSLGAWVLENATLQNHNWIENQIVNSSFKISVNVSPIQFHKENFYSELLNLLEHIGFSPSTLVLEITEGVMMKQPEKMLHLIQKIHNLGIKIAIDDFGTGFSSLSYLRSMPVDILKIDRSFVTHIGSNQKDEAIIKSIIDMANNLGMEVLAEGVETKEQLLFLQDNGCHIIQGYLFSRPLTLADTEQFLRNPLSKHG